MIRENIESKSTNPSLVPDWLDAGGTLELGSLPTLTGLGQLGPQSQTYTPRHGHSQWPLRVNSASFMTCRAFGHTLGGPLSWSYRNPWCSSC